MTNEILIGLGGLVLSVLTFFAGVWITKRRQSRADSEARVRSVLETYLHRRPTPKTGPAQLIKAGIATLASNAEIEQLLSLIVKHGYKHPFSPDLQLKLKDVDLLRFFQCAAEKRVNFSQTSVEDVIRDIDPTN